MLPRGIRRLFRLYRGHGDVQDDLDAEIAFHLDSKTVALIAAGTNPEAAREEALRQFGDVRRARRELAAIDHRDTGRRLRMDAIEAAWSDLRFAARGLARAPAFTAAVVVTLALGLGATAAMFGVLDQLLLRPPSGVQDPQQLVRLYVRHTGKDFFGSQYQRSFPYADFDDFAGARSVLGVAFDVGRPLPVRLDDDLGTAQVQVGLVSGAYFDLLGVRMVRGRPLQQADDSVGSPPAAVVSYGLWKDRYAAAPSVIGRLLHVFGRAYTVVGVAPRDFSGLSPQTVDLWLTVAVAGNDLFGAPTRFFDWRRNNYTFGAVTRVRSGYRPLQAAAELTLIRRRIQSAKPPDRFTPPDSDATVALGSVIPGRLGIALGETGESVSLSLLVAAVALIVCLIAVANVANLLLVRALSRRRETGIRLALGVSRWRLLRSVLAESLLLAAVASAAAAYISSAGGELLRKLLLQNTWAAPLFDWRVFTFVAVTAFGVGTITGLVPAFFGGRTDVLASLRAGVRLSAWRRSRIRGALMVGQVALTLVLLAGFGLFARSLDKAEHVDFGADVNHLVVLSPQRVDRGVSPGESRITSAALDGLLERVQHLPGVRAAALGDGAIPMWSYGVRPLRVEGVESQPDNGNDGPFFSEIGPGYLQVVGLALRRGRTFAPSEYASPASVALVNEEMTRRLWRNQDAIGKCLYVQVDVTRKTQPPCSTVIGVVANQRHDVSGPPLMQYFLPLPRDAAAMYPDIVVRSAGDPERLVTPLTALAKVVQPNLSPQAVRALPTILARQLHSWQLASELLAMFGGLALLVAMVGVYSLVAFDAAQRRHEFGIRVALGARAWDLARLMLGQGLRYGVAGGLLGFALVVVGGRFIASQLFHTSPRDPIALGATALLLLAAILVACALPARSAVRADPRVSLQAD